MSWRFRKTFKVLPGVKLNLTSHGLSATVGASPFSINVGPRGVYGNVSIPGTGLSHRQRLDGPSPQTTIPGPQSRGVPVPLSPPPIVFSTAGGGEIHSASTELLSSESMEQIRRLLKDAFDERAVLTNEIAGATFEANGAKSRYESWNRGFLMKRIRKQSFATRMEAAETATAKLDELKEQLRLTTLATEINVEREQAEPYYRMRDDFAALSECDKIWNVLAEKAIDAIKARSTANAVINRDAVSFSLSSCDLIQWEQQVPHLPNRTGGDMYVYPGFVLYRASKQAFALIDFHDVVLTFLSIRFTEDGPMPSDAQIVGQTWAKSNKDGSPDRRFQGNYQIPVSHYGELLFSTPDGLDVRYLCSNPALAERLVRSWSAFRTSFGNHTPSPSDHAIALRNAFEKFKISNQAFNDVLLASSTGKGSMSKEIFTNFMSAVVEYIDAARRHMENGVCSHADKEKFLHAAQRLESAQKHMKDRADSGELDTESITTFMNAISRFMPTIRFS